MELAIIMSAVGIALIVIPLMVAMGISAVAERSVPLVIQRPVINIGVKMGLSIAKRYQTRCGYPVTSLVFYPPSSPEKSDGFPYLAVYKTPDGRESSAWYNGEGKWTNNPFMKTDLDLVEVK